MSTPESPEPLTYTTPQPDIRAGVDFQRFRIVSFLTAGVKRYYVEHRDDSRPIFSPSPDAAHAFSLADALAIVAMLRGQNVDAHLDPVIESQVST